MKAAVLNAIPGQLEIEEISIDSPGPREVLIQTAAAGLCHSDLHFMEGKYPYPCPAVLGHESAGSSRPSDRRSAMCSRAITSSPVSPPSAVTANNASAAICRCAKTRRPNWCADATRRRASVAQTANPYIRSCISRRLRSKMLIHEHALVKIDKDMPLDKASLIGCGVTTGLGAVFRTAKVEPGSTVAVIGCGGIGLSAIQGARIAGANKVIAVDMVGSKLELAQTLGATHVVNASDGDPVEQVKELTGGGVHNSFEAVGLKATAEQSFGMLRSGGQATVIGMIPVGTKVEIHGPELLSEKTLTGSNMGSNQFRTDMPRFVEMYLDGRLLLDEMVSKTIQLEDINDGFAEMKTGAIARSVITFD